MKFWFYQGYLPDLNAPKTLNEKITWLKLNDRTNLHTECTDKYAVRKYISNTIGDEYLVPLYFHTVNVKDVRPENINKLPCIIKTNNDSGGGYFVRDIRSVNWEVIRKALKYRLSSNYYGKSKEWQYKHIKPRIIVEKLLEDKNGQIPFDYKVHCFNGKPRMISVDMGRNTNTHYRNWYSPQWQREPYSWSSPKGRGKSTKPSEQDVPKPKTLKEMLQLSKKLAEPFTYVRVDWYDVNDKLFFGELTFCHDSGLMPIVPKIWDERLGSELNLSS
nr:ATP-grasp fold amidoligase family protein [Allomuricauda sp.]